MSSYYDKKFILVPSNSNNCTLLKRSIGHKLYLIFLYTNFQTPSLKRNNYYKPFYLTFNIFYVQLIATFWELRPTKQVLNIIYLISQTRYYSGICLF